MMKDLSSDAYHYYLSVKEKQEEYQRKFFLNDLMASRIFYDVIDDETRAKQRKKMGNDIYIAQCV
jgi:hypothetical protein